MYCSLSTSKPGFVSPAPGNASASGDSGSGLRVYRSHRYQAGRKSATSEGANKIVVMDDQLLWTASWDIKCQKVENSS